MYSDNFNSKILNILTISHNHDEINIRYISQRGEIKFE
jgi:hypothetical protein